MAGAKLPGGVAKAERQHKIDAVDLVIRHPGAAVFEHTVTARLEALFGGGGESHLRVERSLTQVHLPLRRHQRLENGQRLFWPPRLTAQTFAVPAPGNAHGANFLRMQGAAEPEPGRIAAINVELKR